MRAAELQKKLISSREAVLDNVQGFLAKGSIFHSTYFSRWPSPQKDPNLPFQITITGDLSIGDFNFNDDSNSFSMKPQRNNGDALDQTFIVPARFQWLGDTETLCPSSWGSKVRSYEGMIIGAAKIQNRNGPNPTWRVTIKYCVQEPTFPADLWVSREDGSIWNGTQFEGKGKSSIKLIRP